MYIVDLINFLFIVFYMYVFIELMAAFLWFEHDCYFSGGGQGPLMPPLGGATVHDSFRSSKIF